MAEGLLTPKQAAERLGISRAALYQAMKSGRLKSTRVLDRIGIRAKDLADYQPRAYRGQRVKEETEQPKRPRGRPRKAAEESPE